MEVKEMEINDLDGELLYYTKKENMLKLSFEEANEMAKRILNRIKEIAHEEGITEEEAYKLFLDKGKMADDFGDWLLSNKDKFKKKLIF